MWGIIGYTIGLIIGTMIVLPVVGAMLSPVWVPLSGLALFQARRRARLRAEAAQIAARAEYEHAMLAQGDLRVGLFGRFPPADGSVNF